MSIIGLSIDGAVALAIGKAILTKANFIIGFFSLFLR